MNFKIKILRISNVEWTDETKFIVSAHYQN
jgi:hypothetical protein